MNRTQSTIRGGIWGSSDWAQRVSNQRARSLATTGAVRRALAGLRPGGMCDINITMQWVAYLLVVVLAVPWHER